MEDRIKPPVLLSRLLTFVFAATLVVLVVMFITLYKMFPLNRPQIFFLQTNAGPNTEMTISQMAPTDANLETYKRAFVSEYIKARNEVVPEMDEMLARWGNGANGVVYAWSTPEIYRNFLNRSMVTALMNATPDFVFSCNVEILTLRPLTQTKSKQTNTIKTTYLVDFRYSCAGKDNHGQTGGKNYTIQVELETTGNSRMQWTDRVNNPLGLRVSGYDITSQNGDPLDGGWKN